MSNPFDGLDFKKVNRSDWLSKVKIDLKGRAVSELDWTIGAKSMSPFFTNDNVEITNFDSRKDLGWEIGEYVKVHDEVEANKLALYALEGGAESVLYDCKGLTTVPNFSKLLQGFYIDFISIHFEVDAGIRNSFIRDYVNYIESNDLTACILRGSIRSVDGGQDTPFALFESHQINGGQYYNGKDDVVEEVHRIYSDLASAFKYEEARNEQSTLLLTIEIDDHFFINISKIRAIRILIARLNTIYKSSNNIDVMIEAHPVIDQLLDINKRYIKTPLMALAATTAGVDRLVLNYGITTDSQKISNRTLRNNNHLLRMESFVDKVEDPAKGSYFIESLTSWIVESVLNNVSKNQ